MSGKIVIALYRPHEGKRRALEELIVQHVATLQRLGLATERRPILARSENGTYMEIFEWRSERASEQAHEHPEVVRLWEAMGGCCDLPRLDSLPEIDKQFPHFEAVDLSPR